MCGASKALVNPRQQLRLRTVATLPFGRPRVEGYAVTARLMMDSAQTQNQHVRPWLGLAFGMVDSSRAYPQPLPDAHATPQGSYSGHVAALKGGWGAAPHNQLAARRKIVE